MVGVKWSLQARDDLRNIHQYISRDAPMNAKAVVQDILLKASELPNVPMSHKAAPEFNDQTIRETSCHSWRIIFKVQQELIVVLTLAHKRRVLQTEQLEFIQQNDLLN